MNQVAHVMQSAGRMKIGDVQYLDVLHQPIGFYLSNLFLVSEPARQKLLFGAAWSLDYEVAFYALFGLALVCWNEPRRLLLAAHGLTLVTLLTCLGGVSLPFPLNLWPQFGLGVVAYDVVTGISPQWIRNVSQLSIPLAAGIGILEICRGFVAPVAHERPSTWIVTAAFACYLIWALPRQSSAPKTDLTRRLASSGAYSYSTYLLHQAILPVLQVVFLKLRVGGSVGILALFMSIGLILQISKSYSRLCETPFKTSGSRQPTEFELPQPAQT